MGYLSYLNSSVSKNPRQLDTLHCIRCPGFWKADFGIWPGSLFGEAFGDSQDFVETPEQRRSLKKGPNLFELRKAALLNFISVLMN